MSEYDYKTLKDLFEACKKIDKHMNNKIQLLELLPLQTSTEIYHSDMETLLPIDDDKGSSISGRYCLDLCTGDSILGQYNVFSIKKEIYVGEYINVDKTTSYSLSVPRLLLAIVNTLPTEGIDKEDLSVLNKNILAILSTTVSVSCRDINYSSKLSVNVRNSLSDIITLRECLKMMVLPEYNPCFIINDRNKFTKGLNSLLNHIEKIEV